eukprot:1994858-Prymnesium_polylepis.2
MPIWREEIDERPSLVMCAARAWGRDRVHVARATWAHKLCGRRPMTATDDGERTMRTDMHAISMDASRRVV